MNAADLAGLLSEPERLRVVAALVLGAATAAEIADRAQLDLRTTAEALARLEAGGLVSTLDGRLVLHAEAFKTAARAAAPRTADEAPTGDPETDAVLRRFLADGRLLSIPATRGKRLKVLEHIAMTFEPGVRYPEREVNTLLRAWYPDYAALRRYLVDEHLLSRQAGIYWRSGGPVIV
ncbi:MAG: DUF2087 domain-containing protein [Actinomycetota bacterium]|nr:DUF2087 domain-containing protein [Actinomycetota bacterium]